jgi:hypothetical protein
LLLAIYLLATPLVWAHYYVIALPALLALATYPLLRHHATGEGWVATDSLVMLAAVIGLAFATVELPLNADHTTKVASPTLAMLLRSVRVLALLIVWGSSMVLTWPMLRRALGLRALPSEKAPAERLRVFEPATESSNAE